MEERLTAGRVQQPTMELLSEIRNGVGLITLNRPAALNALSYDMIGDLRALLAQYAANPGVRAVVVRGAGDKAFCAGGDVRALYQSFKDGSTLQLDFFTAEYALDHLLHFYPKPYLALMNGITMGGGMGIAQGAKLRVVGERTRIAMPEVAIGLFPDVGASYFLPRLPGQLGRYLGLTGVQINGIDALYARLADAYLPAAAVAALEEDLATWVFSAEPRADLKQLLEARAAPSLPPAPLSALRAAIDEHFSRGSVLEILASLEAERRPELTAWSSQTVKLLRSRSPTMLAVTFAQLERGRSLGLADAFRMELGMVAQCFEQGDFIEGIRALIIDKDNAPHWQPGRLEDVTPAMVEAFFADRWSGRVHPLAHLKDLA
jgi:enoyl-CoA hydratase/carnithine racemase